MNLVVLVAAAVAATPPEGIDLEDVDRWEAAARAFERGPEGCWDLEGDLTLRLVHDGGASMFGRAERSDRAVTGRVRGRFADHLWQRFHYTLDAEREPWMVVRPFWGKAAEGAVQAVDAEGRPLVTEAERDRARAQRAELRRRFPALGGEDGPTVDVVSLLSVTWDEDARAVRFEEASTVAGLVRGQAVTVHTIPEGSAQATALDVTLPRDVRFGRWPLQGTVLEGAIHVRSHPAGGVALPHAQRFSAVLGVFGQTLGVDSQVVFTEARRCPAEPPEVTGDAH